MVTIRYSLTPEDYVELERERRGGIGRRIFRISFGALAALVGLITIWQAIFFFPWNRPFGNLLIATVGLVCLWGGLEMPGLTRVFAWFSNPYAPCELQIADDPIVSANRGKVHNFRWRPSRGFQESEAFFFLRARGDDMKWVIPKRAVTAEQQLILRELVTKSLAETRLFDLVR